MARVGLQPELVEQLDEGILVGRDPLAADLEQGAVVPLAAEAAADAVAGLEDEDVLAGLRQSPGGDQTGDALLPRRRCHAWTSDLLLRHEGSIDVGSTGLQEREQVEPVPALRQVESRHQCDVALTVGLHQDAAVGIADER